jgi:hypothetical protein
MKLYQILTLAIGLGTIVHAQETEHDDDSVPNSEQVQKAIEEFNRIKRDKTNEVIVVLEPPAQPPEKSENDEPETKSSEPAETDELADAKTDADETTQPEVIEEIPTPPQGMNVRVESLRTGSGKIDPKTVTIQSSFPVKALAEVPAGWQLERTAIAPAFTREVEIKPGTFISVSITPHLLSPEADGSSVFSVSEPGYHYEKGYQQDHTVGTILEKSISQLDADCVRLNGALSELHRLLASLPKPENTLPEKP